MQITRLPLHVAGSVLSIVGVRVGTEEPHHLRRDLTGSVELRRYGPRVAAETVVTGEDDEAARNVGFRRLAGYIFGGNHRGESIAMTAPVAQEPSGGERIAMTTPVAQDRDDDGWRIRFFMPSRWTLDTLPTPDDDAVRLVTVPGETVAVLRFAGDRSRDAVRARTGELLDTLRDEGVAVTGPPVAWFYDPPWTLPFRRRNEIAVPVEVDWSEA